MLNHYLNKENFFEGRIGHVSMPPFIYAFEKQLMLFKN
jgi:hypothetical protein